MTEGGDDVLRQTVVAVAGPSELLGEAQSPVVRLAAA